MKKIRQRKKLEKIRHFQAIFLGQIDDFLLKFATGNVELIN